MFVDYNCPECKDSPIKIKVETKIIHYLGNNIGFDISLEEERKRIVCEKCGSYLVREK